MDVVLDIFFLACAVFAGFGWGYERGRRREREER